ncbi:MAG: sigma-70 family RNA polymerase sigma factor [Mangrovicoccus sp.]
MPSLDDIESYLARCGIGDKVAFGLLYDATSAKLFGVCLRILNNRSEAEEALQDAYIRIWQKADTYAANGHSPMTWLITVTRNLAIDKLRARRAKTEDLESAPEIADAGPSPEAQALAASEARRVVVCLDALEQDKAEAVRGAYLQGQSYQDLAERFSVPLNTMRTWLRRSLIKLKECLSQ